MTGRKIAAKLKNSFHSYEMSYDTRLQWNSGIFISTNILLSLEKTEISWYNLQELLLKKGTFTPIVALGLPSEGNVPENGETEVGFYFTTMLQHTVRFCSRIS
jgi:hypothetical protein